MNDVISNLCELYRNVNFNTSLHISASLHLWLAQVATNNDLILLLYSFLSPFVSCIMWYNPLVQIHFFLWVMVSHFVFAKNKPDEFNAMHKYAKTLSALKCDLMWCEECHSFLRIIRDSWRFLPKCQNRCHRHVWVNNSLYSECVISTNPDTYAQTHTPIPPMTIVLTFALRK